MKATPGTLYGIYKRAGEQAAMRYWLDDGLPSIGLRPHTVFGPARDQGVTSAPTMAMLAAAAERPYTIPYGGGAQFQYAPDVARAFVQAAAVGAETATVHNLRGAACTIADVIDTIVEACPAAAGSISCAQLPLSFPATVDSDGLEDTIGPLSRRRFRLQWRRRSIGFESRWPITGSTFPCSTDLPRHGPRSAPCTFSLTARSPP